MKKKSFSLLFMNRICELEKLLVKPHTADAKKKQQKKREKNNEARN